jgi:hypothetical protein
MNVTINNRCTNIKLVSPVYFAKDTTRHIQLPQQVDSKSMVKFKFRTSINRDAFGGVLLYHMQGKENASACVRLLVIWGCKSDRIYSHALPIEHKSTFVWNEDKLKMLYDIYDSQYNKCFSAEGWLLNDNTKLKTKCESSYGGLEMNAIISEEKDLDGPIEPLWVDPNR